MWVTSLDVQLFYIYKYPLLSEQNYIYMYKTICSIAQQFACMNNFDQQLKKKIH